MKKGLSILFTLSLFLPLLVSAIEIRIDNPLNYDTFEDLVNAIIGFFFILAVALAPLMIIIGAFYILTAGGDEKKVNTGKNIILYTVIGLIIILIARGLIGIIKGVLSSKP